MKTLLLAAGLLALAFAAEAQVTGSLLLGTNVVTTFSNVDASGFRYLKVATYENVSALNPSNAVSSIAVTYFLK